MFDLPLEGTNESSEEAAVWEGRTVTFSIVLLVDG